LFAKIFSHYIKSKNRFEFFFFFLSFANVFVFVLRLVVRNTKTTARDLFLAREAPVFRERTLVFISDSPEEARPCLPPPGGGFLLALLGYGVILSLHGMFSVEVRSHSAIRVVVFCSSR